MACLRVGQAGPDPTRPATKHSKCPATATATKISTRKLLEEQKIISTTSITVNVSCELDKFRESLASVYLAQPEVPEDTWPPVGSVIKGFR